MTTRKEQAAPEVADVILAYPKEINGQNYGPDDSVTLPMSEANQLVWDGWARSPSADK